MSENTQSETKEVATKATPNDAVENTSNGDTTINVWKRNAEGFVEGVSYIRKADGKVDWRKMVKPEYLVVNKDNFLSRNKDVPESVEGLEDKDLLILLAGIRELARLRGFINVKTTPTVSTPTFASYHTEITWIPNGDTCGVTETFSDNASAHERNTKGFAKHYLDSIAGNRSFVRAVRNYLGIEIVGYDEVGADSEPPTDSNGNPRKYLEGVLKKNNISFEAFKNRMIERKFEGAETWDSIKDVPTEKALELADITIERIQALKASKQK